MEDLASKLTHRLLPPRRRIAGAHHGQRVGQHLAAVAAPIPRDPPERLRRVSLDAAGGLDGASAASGGGHQQQQQPAAQYEHHAKGGGHR